MFFVSRILESLAWILGTVSTALKVILIINALLSWVRPDPSNPIVRFLDQVSDAVCDPIRRLFPTVLGGFDLAPAIAIATLYVLFDMILVPTLMNFSYKLG